MWYSKWLSGVQVQARPKSFTSQSQQQRRQLYPTRQLEDRSSGRQCTNHSKGAPLSFARTGRFGPPGFAGWFAVAGAVVELLLVSASASHHPQSHRACSPHTHTSRAAHTSTTPTASHSLDGKSSPSRSVQGETQRRGDGRAWAEYGTLSPYHHPTSTSRPTRPLFDHALTSQIQHTTKFLLPSPSRSLAPFDTPLPVPISLRTLCAASCSITPNELPETLPK